MSKEKVSRNVGQYNYMQNLTDEGLDQAIRLEMEKKEALKQEQISENSNTEKPLPPKVYSDGEISTKLSTLGLMKTSFYCLPS